MMKNTKHKRNKNNTYQSSSEQCIYTSLGIEIPKPLKPLPDQLHNYEDITQHRRTHILKYIKMYISRNDIKMKDVLKGIERKLNQTHKLTIKQFKAIDKFLIREPCFFGFTRNQLEEHYEYIIQYPKDHPKYRSSVKTKKNQMNHSRSFDLTDIFIDLA